MEHDTPFVARLHAQAERRIFAGQLLVATAGYAGTTVFLNAIRRTASLWIVWPLIAVQIILLCAIFLVSFSRARALGVRYPWLVWVAFALTRVADWQLLVIPLHVVVMLAVSARA